MNAEDEQNCDYSGSQYNVNFYRSRNTDHSSLKYSRLKSSEGRNVVTNVTDTTPKVQPNKIVQNLNTTLLSTPDTTVTTSVKSIEEKFQTSAVNATGTTNEKLSETFLNSLQHLIDYPLTEETFSCRR